MWNTATCSNVKACKHVHGQHFLVDWLSSASLALHQNKVKDCISGGLNDRSMSLRGHQMSGETGFCWDQPLNFLINDVFVVWHQSLKENKLVLENHKMWVEKQIRDKDRCQNWKPGFNWYCSTVIILKGIVWSNTCNVSTHSSLSYRIIGLSFCIEQYIQCEINTFTQMDIIVGAHLYDTRHKNIQVIVSFFFFFFSIYWCEAHLKSTDMFLITLQGLLSNTTRPPPKIAFVFKYPLYPNVSSLSLSFHYFLHICKFRLQV